MNKKGFTLIELIVTIALLAIIMVISFVSITGMINKNNENQCADLEVSLKNATKSYISDNRYNNDVNLTNIKASVLLNAGYLTKEIINPYTNEIIQPDSIEITILLSDNYTPQEITVNEWQNICKR